MRLDENLKLQRVVNSHVEVRWCLFMLFDEADFAEKRPEEEVRIAMNPDTAGKSSSHHLNVCTA